MGRKASAAAAALNADPGKAALVEQERARLMELITGADENKLERVQKELKHLGKIFREVDENKRDFVQRQIQQLAWLNVSIADLQLKVDLWGTLVSYDNGGGQSGIKPNPDVKTLLDYQKSCNTIVRTLIPLVPDKGFSDFMKDLDLDLEEA